MHQLSFAQPQRRAEGLGTPPLPALSLHLLPLASASRCPAVKPQLPRSTSLRLLSGLRTYTCQVTWTGKWRLCALVTVSCYGLVSFRSVSIGSGAQVHIELRENARFIPLVSAAILPSSLWVLFICSFRLFLEVSWKVCPPGRFCHVTDTWAPVLRFRSQRPSLILCCGSLTDSHCCSGCCSGSQLLFPLF